MYMCAYNLHLSDIERITHVSVYKAIYLYAARPLFSFTFSFLLVRVIAARWLRKNITFPRRPYLFIKLVTAAVYPASLLIQVLTQSAFCAAVLLFLLLHPWFFLIPGALWGLDAYR